MKIILYLNQMQTEEEKLNMENCALIGQAVEIKKQTTGELHLFFSGQNKQQFLVREALARGCDSAVFIENEDCESNPGLLPRYLAEKVKKEQPDLFLTGYRMLDGAGGYLGTQIAGILKFPLISMVSAVTEVLIDSENLTQSDRPTASGKRESTIEHPTASGKRESTIDRPTASGKRESTIDHPTASEQKKESVFDYSNASHKLKVEQTIEGTKRRLQTTLPCVITLANSITEKKTMSVMNIIAACDKTIELISEKQWKARTIELISEKQWKTRTIETISEKQWKARTIETISEKRWKDSKIENQISGESDDSSGYYLTIAREPVAFQKKECRRYYTIAVEDEQGELTAEVISPDAAVAILMTELQNTEGLE